MKSPFIIIFILIVLLSLLVFNSSFSGELGYSTYLGGSGDEYGQSIAIDSSGNAYITGRTNSSNFPTIFGAYNVSKNIGYDVFVCKLNANGTALVHSTYLGGSANDYGNSIAVDNFGNAYITGYTASTDFPTSPGALKTLYNGGNTDVFISKLNPSGTALVYSTYFGGGDSDYSNCIVVDSSGNTYITGYTFSNNFPTTLGALDTSFSGGGSPDGFVTKLNASGTALVYSTYLGGSANDYAYSITVDISGNAYITGQTGSNNFPITPGAFDTSKNVGYDAFVTKLNASGTALVYSTYLGGKGSNDDDNGSSIAIDGLGNAYITGYTFSYYFPTTSNAYDTAKNAGWDAFVSKLNASGNAIVYSTYLGGRGNDYGYSIAVDNLGNTYITGYTASTDFPITPDALDISSNGYAISFVTKLNASGAALVYSTYLGGGSSDYGQSIAIDSLGNAYITGYTSSTNFATTPGALDTSKNGGTYDGFVSKITSIPVPVKLSLFRANTEVYK